MFKRFIIFVCFLCLSVSLHAQKIRKSDSLNVKETIDTLLIDRDMNNWSIRVFANYKGQKFTLKDGSDKLSFVPNNKFGVGVGLGTSKLIVDIAVNLKGSKEDQTKRFDMQGSLILGDNNLIGILVQRYKGFNVYNNFNEPEAFRDDILSVSVGLSYLYTLNDISFSANVVETRLEKLNKKHFMTVGFGGFLIYDDFSANSSVIPEDSTFNNGQPIDEFRGYGLGVSCGFMSLFILPKNFFASLNAIPGIGVMSKSVSSSLTDNKVSNPMLYRLDFDAGIGYNWDRFYSTLSYGSGIYTTNLNNGMNYLFSNTKAKLAIGYKIRTNKKLKTPF
ncbi:DUF4421 family protein [Bizionia arctica]|uniref:DUF4421 domain-containing protein n=1 Tax=Bizionia arctica TaxID=1495645 RepID=A0A917GX20_9FLAO|nr:DUF4421 family protein [Bizionia arctica]GGG59746.1 hypothetical protein GCM10010976_33140 [Bizionia arctica]